MNLSERVKLKPPTHPNVHIAIEISFQENFQSPFDSFNRRQLDSNVASDRWPPDKEGRQNNEESREGDLRRRHEGVRARDRVIPQR